MIRRTVTLPEIGLIAGTRVALGAGIGLLLADRLNNDERRAAGWTLVAVGVLTTIPLVAKVILDHESSGEPGEHRGFAPRSNREENLISSSDV
jgi:hypothetical protein